MAYRLCRRLFDYKLRRAVARGAKHNSRQDFRRKLFDDCGDGGRVLRVRVCRGGRGNAVLSGRRVLSELCGQQVAQVDSRAHGHLPRNGARCDGRRRRNNARPVGSGNRFVSGRARG